MSRITARSKDSTLCIEREGRSIRFFLNGEEDAALKSFFDTLPSEPMGGTCYPKPGTMLAYYNLLTNGPMSMLYDTVEVTGNIGTIPHAPEGGGIVY